MERYVFFRRRPPLSLGRAGPIFRVGQTGVEF